MVDRTRCALFLLFWLLESEALLLLLVLLALLPLLLPAARTRRVFEKHLIQKNEIEKERKIKRVSDLCFAARSIEQTERQRQRQRGKKNISRERDKDILFRPSTSRFLFHSFIPCRYSYSSSNDGGTRGTPRATTRRNATTLPSRASSRSSQMCSRFACVFFFFFFCASLWVAIMMCDAFAKSTQHHASERCVVFVWGWRRREISREFSSDSRLTFPA